VLCSDFDGTLAPIVHAPDEAHALPAAAAAMRWLSRDGARQGRDAACATLAAVVTARDSDDAARRAGLGPEAVVVGNAGLERLVGGAVEVDREVQPWLPHLAHAAAALQAALDAGRCRGARLERKRCAVVLHVRGVHGGAEREAADLAAEVAGSLGLRVVTGKRAVELRPPVRLDKGSAVVTLRSTFDGAALAVAGDDLPDLPMLRVAAAEDHLAVAVADVEAPADVVDVADWVVDGPWGWAETLQRVVGALRR